MPMAPNSSGENSRWWSTFHLQHGLNSADERGFMGYLVTQGLVAFALSATQLDASWAAYLAWRSS